MASAIVSKQPTQAPQGRKQRPNYNQIHRHLLPVEVYPLPPLIPHNPVSVVAIVLSYLTQLLAPPQRPTYNGYFSSATSSIHVTDPAAIRALWEMGFFGRGSLSRSEPTWQDSQKNKGLTAEENTGVRRNERRQIKLERAKKEQQEIAQQLLQETTEVAAAVTTNTDQVIDNDGSDPNVGTSSKSLDALEESVQHHGLPTPPSTSTSSETEQTEARPGKRTRGKSVRFSPTIEAREFDLSSPVISPIKAPGISADADKEEQHYQSAIKDQEHLNLSLEEAFFLSYGLGVLKVHCEDTDTLLPPTSLLSLFRRHSCFPTHSLSLPVEPDDPFMLSYAVYHHYRSLGWVVRSGVKFSADYLLYNRGPAFSHAEFAVVIIPSYSHSYWNETVARQAEIAKKTARSWSWLHNVNRVQAQVHKQLILCYVDIPPPLASQDRASVMDIGKELGRYKVRDIGIRRWTPNRSRD